MDKRNLNSTVAVVPAEPVNESPVSKATAQEPEVVKDDEEYTGSALERAYGDYYF